VATHLAKAIKDIGIGIDSVYSPNKTNAADFSNRFDCKALTSANDVSASADLVILAVPDSKVQIVCDAIPDSGKLFCHTSGITDMQALKSKSRFGVFYPLQTFSKLREVDMKHIPFCLEANKEDDLALLSALASRISENVRFVNSHKRKILHLTAVMVSNFSNHLYHLAYDILESNELDFNFLKPLIKETALKVQGIHPLEAQTGPARRNDIPTLDEHIEMLMKFPEYQHIYKILSEQIRKKYHE
jgi:predicted short-subunit dehydrogenase-like oxidoreductase (DUF2520 family)